MFDRRFLLTVSLFSIFTSACPGGGGSNSDDGGADEGAPFAGGIASARIGPGGGEIELGEIKLEIPAGALAAETEISVEASAMTIDGIDPLSAVYVFSPNGLTFAVPARLKLKLEHGAPGALLFHGDELGAAAQPIEATIRDGRVEASIDGFSYYVVGTMTHPIIDVDEGFEFEGYHYTAGPVGQDIIGGYAYSFGDGAGVNDGEAMNGRVWFDDSYCITFRPDGTGVRDDAGGTGQRYDDFPLLYIDALPGQAEPVRPVTSHGMSPAGAAIIDPEYDRTAELHPFRWGVRLNDDDTIFQTSEGYFVTQLVFDDGSLGSSYLWDPATNGPVSSLPGIGLLSQALPTEQHFCRYREVVSMSADGDQSRCVQSIEPYSGGLMFTKSACYSHGVLQGPYSMTDMYGAQIEAGQFANNRPVGGWSFSTLEGVLQATGAFSEDGMQQGEWHAYDYQGKLEAVLPYQAGLTPNGRGSYYAVLNGTYKGYRTTFEGTSYLEREGGLFEGKRSGPWYGYNEMGVRVSEENYVIDTQIPNGEWCFSLPGGGFECVPISFSWRNNANYYDWGGCVSGVNTWTHHTYDMNGSVIASECYELTGTTQEPVQGTMKPCGSACSQ